MKNFRIDSQVLTSVSHCPLRAKYTFIDRLKPREENKNFTMGTAVHLGLETYYRMLKQREKFETRVEAALNVAQEYMLSETMLEPEDVRTVLRTLKEYFDHRASDKLIIHEVETPFSKILYEGKDLTGEDITILYEGKIDLIAEDEEKRVYDHKTTSRNFEPTDLTNQFIGYHWATNLPVVINRIGFQASLKPEQKFKRFFLRFTPETVEAWQEFAVMKSLELAYYIECGRFPQNFASCDGKFGFPCTYINLCRYPTLIEETIQADFKIGEPWDPLKERNT